MIRVIDTNTACRRGACIGLLTALVTAGCVTPGSIQDLAGTASSLSGSGNQTTPMTSQASDASLTPAERRMRQQSEAFQRTVWEGALIGASAGALWGAIQGGRVEDVLKKAAIGGAAGALAGAYVAHKQKQYSTKEDQLDSMIADVRQSNGETKSLIASVREVIAEDKRRLASVSKRVRAGKATQAELEQTRRRIGENRAVIAQAAKGAREKESMFQGAENQFRKDHPGTNTSRMQQELNDFRGNIKTLDGLVNTVSLA